MSSGMVVVIPSLNPDGKLLKLVKALVNEFTYIVIVNDGSTEKYDGIYQQAVEAGKGAVTVVKHCVNCGKGRALKTAFNYALTNFGGGYFRFCLRRLRWTTFNRRYCTLRGTAF